MRKQYVLASTQTDPPASSDQQEPAVASSSTTTTPLLAASLRRAGSRPLLRRQGSSARRTGPTTPPLHQLLLANGTLSTISILSSPALTSNGTSPRSSASLDSLVDDGSVTLSADEQIKPKELVTMLAEENEELYLDNLEFKELLDARQQALVRAQADLKESKASIAGLEKKLQRKQEKYQLAKSELYESYRRYDSVKYVSSIFCSSFKTHRLLAEEREKANEELRRRNDELLVLLEEMTRDKDVVSADKAQLLAEKEELLAEKDKLQKEKEQLQLEREQAQAESERLQSEKEELKTSHAKTVEELHAEVDALRANIKLIERKNAQMLDKNAFLTLQIDELETRLDERSSQMEGLEARNEELCDTIRLMQEREEELENKVEEARADFHEVQGVLEDLEAAYLQLKTTGRSNSYVPDDRSERASITSEDMDVAALEDAANAVNEHGEHVEHERHHRSYERPSSTVPEIDTSDPSAVAAQIKRLERLIDEYHDCISSLRHERAKLSDRALEIEDMERDLQGRLDKYREIQIDFRERENDFYAGCEIREKEFLDLSDEYEQWRLDCEVRELKVEEERIEVWRFRRELERRLERVIHREALVRKREGEVRWRLMCLDGAFANAEGCWRCIPQPPELFPPTPELDMKHIEDEVEEFAAEQELLRQEALRVAEETGNPPVQPECSLVPIRGLNREQAEERLRELVEDDVDERYLREELDAPFEFDTHEAVRRYIEEQEQYERDYRMDEFIDFQAEEPELQQAAAEFDEIVHAKVDELMRQADEKRRQVKEAKERKEIKEAREGEIPGVYDPALAKLNNDGLHGLGLVMNPEQAPESEDATHDPSALSSAFTFSCPKASTSTTGAETSSSTTHALATDVATYAREESQGADAVEGGAEELTTSWEDVTRDTEVPVQP